MKKSFRDYIGAITYALSALLFTAVVHAEGESISNRFLQNTPPADTAEADLRFLVSPADPSGDARQEEQQLTLAEVKALLDTASNLTDNGDGTSTITFPDGSAIILDNDGVDNDTIYTDPDADAVTPDSLTDNGDGTYTGTGDVAGVDTTADSNPYDPTGTDLTAATVGDAIDELATFTRTLFTPNTDTTGTGGLAATTAEALAQDLQISFTGENENLTDLSAANSIRPQIEMDGQLGTVSFMSRNHHSRGARVSKSGSDNRVGADGRALSPYDMLHPFATPKAAETALAADPDFDPTQDSIYITPGTYTEGVENLGSDVERWVLDNANLVGSGIIFDVKTQNIYIEGVNKPLIESTGNWAIFLFDSGVVTGDRTISFRNLEFSGAFTRAWYADNRVICVGVHPRATQGHVEYIVEDCTFQQQALCYLRGGTEDKPHTAKYFNCDFRYGTFSAPISTDASLPSTLFSEFYFIGCITKGALGNNNGISSRTSGAHILQSNLSPSASPTVGQEQPQNGKFFYLGGHTDATDANNVFGVYTNSQFYVYIDQPIFDGDAPSFINAHVNTMPTIFEFAESTPINFDPVANSSVAWIHGAGTYIVDTNRTN